MTKRFCDLNPGNVLSSDKGPGVFIFNDTGYWTFNHEGIHRGVFEEYCYKKSTGLLNIYEVAFLPLELV